MKRQNVKAGSEHKRRKIVPPPSHGSFSSPGPRAGNAPSVGNSTGSTLLGVSLQWSHQFASAEMPRHRVRGQTREARVAQAATVSEVPVGGVSVFEAQTQVSIRIGQGTVQFEAQSRVPTVVTQTYTTKIYPRQGHVPMPIPTRMYGSSANSRAHADYPQHTVLPQKESAMARISRFLETAIQFGCWSFSGAGDGVDAQRWLGRVIRTTADLRLSETDRVTLATRFLEGEAESWWDIVQAGYEMQASWADFLREFREQYPAPRLRAQMALDFYQLTQGDRSVTEFEIELRRLYQAVPQDDRSEALLAQRFVEGLSTEIQATMGADAAKGYDALVMAAVRAEMAVVQPGSGRSHGRDSGARHSTPRSRQVQDSDSQGDGTARAKRSRSYSSRSRQSVSQTLGAEPEAMAQSSYDGPLDREREDKDIGGRRQAVSQQIAARPSGFRIRGRAWRPPRGVSSRFGTSFTREITEAPPLDNRFRFGFPAMYRAEHYSFEEVRPLYQPRPPIFETGGPSRRSTDVD